MNSSFFKRIGTFVVLVLVAAFVACMFLPISSLVADLNSTAGGHKAPSSYVDVENRYYYKSLNENEKHAYRLIYASLPDFPHEVMVPKLNTNELENVFEALSYDNPELFFMGKRCSLTSIGNVYYFIPEYTMNKSTYDFYMSQVEAKAAEIVFEANKLSDDYEKELYIHDYLTENCVYNNVEGDSLLFTVYGLLIDGKANCEGYSRATQYLLNKCGIVNHLVGGVAPDADGSYQGHMWNAVCVDDEWYNLDVTWDDYLVGDSVECPDNTPSHIYFNISTADLSNSHSADNSAIWKDCTGESFGYFVKNGAMFDTYDTDVEYAIKDRLVEIFKDGNMSAEFAFRDKATFDRALNTLTNSRDGRMYTILSWVNHEVENNKVNSGRIQFTSDENMLVMRFFFTK